MEADEMSNIWTPSMNTDHWYTRPWRDTLEVPSASEQVVVYASASSFRVPALVIVTDDAPEMDTTGALAVFTTSGTLACAHAPRKLHSLSDTE